MRFRRRTLLGLLLGTACCSAWARDAAAQANPVQAHDDLLGLWGAEPQLGPQVRGAITVERLGRTWSLRVGGIEAAAVQQGDSVVVALPGGQGTLRLYLRTAEPEAFWVQPAGLNAPYASPVHLRRTQTNRWVGTVTPVPEQFPLYLMVTRASDGTLRGTFRNPEVNWPGRVAAYVVTRRGNDLLFTHPRTGVVQYTQPYDSARRTITFDFGAPIVLTPRTREQAVGFVTRSPSLAPYRYRMPSALNDGWMTATPQSVRMNTEALQRIVRALVAVDPLSETAPRVHALVIARNGQLVLDEYFRGYDASMMHDLRSASKTLTSVMVGAAMQRGATVEGSTISHRTPVGTSGMTLGHLLSHSTGLSCDDNDSASPGNEDTMQSQQQQNDWYAFFMALPRVAAPGSRYSYCSAGMNMAGGVVGRATGQWLPRFFEQTLARPLQFGDYGINLMPNGDAYAGGGMRLRPRDLLKVGQLYLNGGQWRGVPLVPASWVRLSTAHVIDRPDSSSDGYGWHRHELTVGGRRYRTYEAGGNGGQFLVVVPELRLTMVITAGNYGQYDVWMKLLTDLVPQVIAAAHRDATVEKR